MYKLKFLSLIVFLTMAAVFSAVVMLLWNWLMPAIFGLVSIHFWQALGILVLCRILFGSFGAERHLRHGHRGRGHGRNHLREKWIKMTPEERTEFVNRRKEHFKRKRGHFDRSGLRGRPDFDPFTTDENIPKDKE